MGDGMRIEEIRRTTSAQQYEFWIKPLLKPDEEVEDPASEREMWFKNYTFARAFMSEKKAIECANLATAKWREAREKLKGQKMD